MRAVFLSLLGLLLALPAQAQRVPDLYVAGQVPAPAVYPRLYQPATMTLTGAGGAAAAAAFSGIGDVVAGSKMHYGTIAYDSAHKNSKALNLCNVSDAACADVNFVNGFVSSTQVIGGTTCGTTVGVDVCTVKTIYDDTGQNYCTSAACDQAQATISNRCVFVPNVSGTIPGIKCVSSSSQAYVTSNAVSVPISQVISQLGAYSIASNPGGNKGVAGCGTTIAFGYGAGPKQFGYANAILSTSTNASTGTLYSIITTQDGSGNGTIARNGTTTTGSIGTATCTGASSAVVGRYDVGGATYGDITWLEMVPLFLGNISGTNITNLTSTMQTNGGY